MSSNESAEPAESMAEVSETNKDVVSDVNKQAEANIDPEFIPPPEEPTQEAVPGISFDFCHSCRIRVTQPDRDYDVSLFDEGTRQHLFTLPAKPDSWMAFNKRYFIDFRLVITDRGTGETVYEHRLNLKDRDVLIPMPGGALGDTIGWFSYLDRFQKKHDCNLYVASRRWLADLCEKQYPNIKFISVDDGKKLKPYAMYRPGLFFKDNVDDQPIDFRFAGNHRTCANILGVSPDDIPPRFDLSAPRQIKEKYVCIAAQGSAKAKCWNNPVGWYEVIKFLKANGYRVLCIDKSPAQGDGLDHNTMPPGCEDFTGDIHLQERINLIKDADFFIGLSSGLSWVAWGCNVPVVMISGFTWPTNEFYTPYRVINYNVCSGCWNDMKVQFDHHDYMWCPRHKNDRDRHICSRAISAGQVIDVIQTIPTFKPAG